MWIPIFHQHCVGFPRLCMPNSDMVAADGWLRTENGCHLHRLSAARCIGHSLVACIPSPPALAANSCQTFSSTKSWCSFNHYRFWLLFRHFSPPQALIRCTTNDHLKCPAMLHHLHTRPVSRLPGILNSSGVHKSACLNPKTIL